LIISLVVSIKSKEFKWFQRVGAILTIFGTLFILKHTIMSTLEQEVINRHGYARYAPSKKSQEMKEQTNKVSNALKMEKISIIMTMLGTIIWGYGDLIKQKNRRKI